MSNSESAIKMRLWRAKNPERAKLASKLQKRAEYARNPDKFRRRSALNRLGKWGKEYARECTRRWQKNNREKVNAYSRARDYLKRGVRIGDWGAIYAIYKRAQELRKWFEVEVDHIMPLSKGGSHSVDNLQIIYKRENRDKRNRLDYKAQIVFD